MDNIIIEVRKLKKDYHVGEVTVHALRGIDLTIKEGEFLAVMGSSGSGKSTLLNILGCLDKPTSGRYSLKDTDISTLTKNQLAGLRNTKIGFVFQSYNLLPRTTALENVELPLYYNNRIRSKQRRKLAEDALAAVGLGDRMAHMPNQLSGGQQQRVAIARSLVNNPSVILADEPTGNLDTRSSYEIMDIFQKLNNQGKTIVIVTHEPDISKMTKRNVLFRDGHIYREQVLDDRLIAEALIKNLPGEEEE